MSSLLRVKRTQQRQKPVHAQTNIDKVYQNNANLVLVVAHQEHQREQKRQSLATCLEHSRKRIGLLEATSLPRSQPSPCSSSSSCSQTRKAAFINISSLFLHFLLIQLVVGHNIGQEDDATAAGEFNDELVLAQAVWRHGARSPIDTYKLDPYQEDAWPQGWEQLMPAGVRQHVDLGRRLRNRYMEKLRFLSPNYDSRQIYVHSTDFNRTLLSAMANMQGFYPPTDVGNGNDPYSFVLVPIHTIEKERDRIVPDVKCQRNAALIKLITNTTAFTKFVNTDEIRELLANLSKHCGEPITQSKVALIDDTLYIEELNNLTLPEWTKETRLRTTLRQFADKLRDWSSGQGLGTEFGLDMDLELARVRGGTMLWTLIDNMRTKWQCLTNQQASNAATHSGAQPQKEEDDSDLNRTKKRLQNQKQPPGDKKDGNASVNATMPPANCRNDHCHSSGDRTGSWIGRRRYFAYSAHDSTIAALFRTLGLLTNGVHDGYPNYASTILVELWVRRYFRNKTKAPSPSETYFIKLLYWPGFGDPFEGKEFDLTDKIQGCKSTRTGTGSLETGTTNFPGTPETSDERLCTLDAFVQRSEPYKPIPTPDKLCAKVDDLPKLQMRPANGGEKPTIWTVKNHVTKEDPQIGKPGAPDTDEDGDYENNAEINRSTNKRPDHGHNVNHYQHTIVGSDRSENGTIAGTDSPLGVSSE